MIGSNSIAAPGKPGSIAWTNTLPKCRKRRRSMAAARDSAVATSAAPELFITRVFDAPRERVFEAWTKPEHLVHWSAPNGYTMPHCEGELRPGGQWRCCMRSPEGVDLWLGGVYRE